MRTAIVTSLFLITIFGCGGGGGGGNNPDLAPVQCQPHTVACTDQSIQQLSMFDTVSDGQITNTEDNGVFTTHVDATGGGLTPTESYVYAKFTATGLVAVAVSDEAAFNSTEWDIAFRRFIIRLNSGVSGPGCVTAARTATGTDFATLTTVPSGLDHRVEEYFSDPTGTCELVPDGSGLGSPGVAMQSFWSYQACVAMTRNVFVITPSDGKAIKLFVDSYYSPAKQAECDATGAMPTGNPGSGNIVIKWAYLQ